MAPASFIVVGGVCGTGKSTVGTELARRLGYVFLDADDFHSLANKAKMAAGQGLTDEDRRPWLETLAAQGQRPERIVLACSALKAAYRSTILKARPDAIVIMLDVGRNILEERLRARTAHYATSTLLDSQFATLESASVSESRVFVVDGSRTLPEVVDETLSIVDKHQFEDESVKK